MNFKRKLVQNETNFMMKLESDLQLLSIENIQRYQLVNPLVGLINRKRSGTCHDDFIDISSQFYDNF